MQNQIEAGISEADRCYTRIAELEEQNAALAAQVEALIKLGNKVAQELIHANYGTSCEILEVWHDFPKITAQQHLANLRAEAVERFALKISNDIGDGFGRAALIIKANQYAESIRQGVTK